MAKIDILVREGFYSNRTDFIRTAIRNQLDRHNDVVKQSVARHQLHFGLRHYSRQDLENVQAALRWRAIAKRQSRRLLGLMP